VTAATIHAGTGLRVGHGSLSEYRKSEEAIRADFSDGGVRISFEDNFLAVGVEASDAKAAYDAARAFAELFAQALSVQFGMRFGAEFLFVEDHEGLPQRVPKSYQVPFGATWYNLAVTRDSVPLGDCCRRSVPKGYALL